MTKRRGQVPNNLILSVTTEICTLVRDPYMRGTFVSERVELRYPKVGLASEWKHERKFWENGSQSQGRSMRPLVEALVVALGADLNGYTSTVMSVGSTGCKCGRMHLFHTDTYKVKGSSKRVAIFMAALDDIKVRTPEQYKEHHRRVDEFYTQVVKERERYEKLEAESLQRHELTFLPAEIGCEEDVRKFFRGLLEKDGVSFHPDEKFENYINKKTKAKTYAREQAEFRDKLMKQSFELLGERIYEVAVQVSKEFEKTTGVVA